MKKITLPLIIAVLIVMCGVASALDSKHNYPITCTSCHIAHSSIGGGMTNADKNANLCLSCHTSTGMAGKKPFIDTMKASTGKTDVANQWDVPLFIGTSHAWDVPLYNEARGTDYPTNPDLFTRLDPIIMGKVTGAASYSTTTSLRSIDIQFVTKNDDPTKVRTLDLKDKMIQFFFFAQMAAGTSTGGTTTAIQDSTRSWTDNQWTDYYVNMKSGANKDQSRKILSNTANTITVSSPFAATVSANDTYEILDKTYANSGEIRKVTANTNTTITYEAFPFTPKTGEKFAIMGSYITTGEKRLIDGKYMAETDALVTKFSCSTCHNQHLQEKEPWDPFASSPYVAYVSNMANPSTASNNRKFLRIDTNRGQLCLACHKRKAESASIDTRVWTGKYKSHPVGKGLGEVRNPSQFNSEPLDANFSKQLCQNQNDKRYSLNGAGDNNLTNNIVLDADGKVQCLSCHGMHYTDSNSTTRDKP